jgi:hypothetical protein
VKGRVFYAIGILFGDAGIPGDADLAVLEFEESASCPPCTLCFGDENPFHTYLSDDEGQAVPVVPHCSDPIRAGPGLLLEVPESVNGEVGCYETRLDVPWGPPIASASCGNATLDCRGEHESGYVFDDESVRLGGEMPRGLSTFCCTADGDCEARSEACWTVNVRDPSSFLHLRAEPGGVDKNRFISVYVDTEGRSAAIRVTLRRVYDEDGCPPRGPELPDLGQFEGTTRWVGPPFEVSESEGDEPPMFLAARLQCCPYFADWTALLDGRLLNVFGPEVVPCSEYEVELVPGCCADAPDDPQCGAAGLLLATARWGDVTDPMGDEQPPNYQDITAGVEKFKRIPFDPGPPPTGALSKTRTMLRGNDLDVHSLVNFLDIGYVVRAYKGLPYGEAGPVECTEPCP